MDLARNACMLHGRLAKNGYDWWWHSFVGRSERTGELRPFFIEYFFVNPGLGGADPILGQTPEHRINGVRPSYGMLKAGAWGERSAFQINNYFGIASCRFSTRELDVQVGSASLTETRLQGAVSLSEAQARPELMSDVGALTWDLQARKCLTYDVGVGASRPLREAGAFHMFWHVQGMRTEYDGELVCNGEKYLVKPEWSAGYQDKNWGTDFTNPWVWLNCNRFFDAKTQKELSQTSLVVGGGTPVLMGVPLKRKLLIALFHEGRLYEFHFLKLWENPQHRFECILRDGRIWWNIEAQSLSARIEISFSCPLSKMLRIHYENPRGQRLHRDLWNGGHAEGTLRLFERSGLGWKRVAELRGELGGCEYGVH